MKQIQVTDSFLTLDQEVRGCQNEESYDKCTSRNYEKKILKKCGCLHQSISTNSQVFFFYGDKTLSIVNVNVIDLSNALQT